jgi:hypothetical protein
MSIIDKNVFTELAYNNPRDASLALYHEAEQARELIAQQAAQIEALQQTVAHLFEQVMAPAGVVPAPAAGGEGE